MYIFYLQPYIIYIYIYIYTYILFTIINTYTKYLKMPGQRGDVQGLFDVLLLLTITIHYYYYYSLLLLTITITITIHYHYYYYYYIQYRNWMLCLTL